MKSKRFKKLPINTSTLPAESIEKLLPEVKKNCTTKFDESIDLSLQINNKQKKNEVNLRTVVTLPSGIGKNIKVLATLNGEPVMITDGRHYVCSFHPEIGSDSRIHEYYLNQINE